MVRGNSGFLLIFSPFIIFILMGSILTHWEIQACVVHHYLSRTLGSNNIASYLLYGKIRFKFWWKCISILLEGRDCWAFMWMILCLNNLKKIILIKAFPNRPKKWSITTLNMCLASFLYWNSKYSIISFVYLILHVTTICTTQNFTIKN